MIKIYNENDIFTIDWTINTLCTYHCSYCPTHLHTGNNFIFNKNDDIKILQTFLNKLKSQLQNKAVHVFINGGEPTISKNFDFLLNTFDKFGWYCHIQTNCSRSLKWWKSHSKKIFKVSISYHPEWNKNDDIFEKTKLISENTNTGVFVLMYPKYWNQCIDAFTKFKNIKTLTNLNVSRVFKRNKLQNDESYVYSDEQLLWFQENSNGINRVGRKSCPDNKQFGKVKIQYEDFTTKKFNEKYIVNNRLNKFINWKCNMGIEHIHINGNGLIKGAACSSGTSLGTIQTFDTLHKNPTTCSQEYCNCTLDTMITKEFI